MNLKIEAVFGRADLGLSLEYFKPQLAEKNLNEDFCFWRIRVKERMLRRIECRKRGFSSVQFSSVAHSFLTLCDPMNHRSTDLPVHHQLPESTQIHVH